MKKFIAVLGASTLLGGCQAILGEHSIFARHAPQVEVRALGSEQTAATAIVALAAGRKALADGEIATAIAAFRSASLDPGTAAAAHNGLGVAYAALGRGDLAERYFIQAIAEDPADQRFAANLAKYHRSRAAALAKAQLPEPAAVAAAEVAASRVMSAGPSQVAVGSPAAQGGYTRLSRQEIEIRTASPDHVQPAVDGRRRNPRYTSATAAYPVRVKLAPAAPVNAPTGFPVRVRLADAKAK